MDYFKELPKAGKIELFLAKLLGEKHIVTEEYLSVTIYLWRGKIYATEISIDESGLV
ncbi:MAG: hypothetical protein KDH96_12065 [Candidatus Riesia sp.]|nr:hypothetical protein [Candidatus Riesia sp.]